ncbi:cupin [Mycolicibacterium celeriflavum]|uniref:cupin domain-containing protein n=1 Tax=Mycolicibacterium celeriflavum TaxID=1249101 RepID=UPI0007FF17DE|nr:cupin domain-containing protein [Mycolicibacterium celeriflavum]MCV7238928.1 cupin domain-containing protein [Mycolicibacterium celeriflavum]OBG18507.1 cupin [Mycolicibacterium celeriflavum]ORA50509.1 cupin [Mycolicibacterium celeriflavum]
MQVRRVVTGHDPSGKSVFVSDANVAPIETMLMPGFENHLLWGSDASCRFPDDGSMPQWRNYFPPVGGFRFAMLTLPPSHAAEPPAALDVDEAMAEMEEKLPGMLGYLDYTDPGMHTTPTVDFEVVLDGTVVLELDDGAEVTLHPGDTVVQNGTRHRWKNPGDKPARMAVFICGAEHADVTAT